jgi:hypothetical protein
VAVNPFGVLAAALRAKMMRLDATSLMVLDRDATGRKRLGALWGYVGDHDVHVLET